MPGGAPKPNERWTIFRSRASGSAATDGALASIKGASSIVNARWGSDADMRRRSTTAAAEVARGVYDDQPCRRLPDRLGARRRT